jgi:hypothetical protein
MQIGEHALEYWGIQPGHQRVAHTAVFRPQFLFSHELASQNAMQ